jgi:hypothetical protein
MFIVVIGTNYQVHSLLIVTHCYKLCRVILVCNSGPVAKANAWREQRSPPVRIAYPTDYRQIATGSF